MLWLALVVVVAQLWLAWHQVEHLDGDKHNDCPICLVGQGIGHAPTSSVNLLPETRQSVMVATVVAVILRRSTVQPYWSRAPPR